MAGLRYVSSTGILVAILFLTSFRSMGSTSDKWGCVNDADDLPQADGPTVPPEYWIHGNEGFAIDGHGDLRKERLWIQTVSRESEDAVGVTKFIPIPEPATTVLLLSALALGVAVLHRHRTRW